MPFQRPTLADIDARIAADIESRLPGAGARLQRRDGTAYRVTAPVRIAGGMAVVKVTAEMPGAGGNSDGALRARLLDRIRRPPHGGAAHDYRAWAYPSELGPGTVTVRVMADELTADGIPSAATVAAVTTYIDARRPVTAAAAVVAPGRARRHPADKPHPGSHLHRRRRARSRADLASRRRHPRHRPYRGHGADHMAIGEDTWA